MTGGVQRRVFDRRAGAVLQDVQAEGDAISPARAASKTAHETINRRFVLGPHRDIAGGIAGRAAVQDGCGYLVLDEIDGKGSAHGGIGSPGTARRTAHGAADRNDFRIGRRVNIECLAMPETADRVDGGRNHIFDAPVGKP